MSSIDFSLLIYRKEWNEGRETLLKYEWFYSNELEKSTDVSIYEYEVFSDVIRRIEEAFNENFKHSDPDATSNKSRHKIAHGHAYEAATEVNSLKRFLYLNEIYHLFVLLSNSEQES